MCALLLAIGSAAAGNAAAQGTGRLAPEEGERALERALARQSVLVVPSGLYEIEPSLEYTYRGSDALSLISSGGTAQIAEQDLKQERIEARVTVRAGLPFAAHVEARFPLAWVHEQRAVAGQQITEQHGGAGDLELGISKQLAEESPSHAGWVASLNWRSATGRFHPGEPSPGSGFDALLAGVSFAKRQDPLVFFGGATYTYTRERRHDGIDINPGDAVGLKLGAILAASPRTSLRGAFEVTRSARAEVQGAKLAGSDGVAAALQFGLGALLSRRSLLDIQLSIGVTPDAPDFTVTAALPVRFP